MENIKEMVKSLINSLESMEDEFKDSKNYIINSLNKIMNYEELKETRTGVFKISDKVNK